MFILKALRLRDPLAYLGLHFTRALVTLREAKFCYIFRSMKASTKRVLLIILSFTKRAVGLGGERDLSMIKFYIIGPAYEEYQHVHWAPTSRFHHNVFGGGGCA